MLNSAAGLADEFGPRVADSLCSLLRGGPWTNDASDGAGMLNASVAHRVHFLLLEELRDRGPLGEADAAMSRRLEAAERQAAIAERVRARELGRVLGELAQAGVLPVMFKGQALAYTCYRRPHLRPREDVDFLIPRTQVDEADRTLLSLGYARANLIGGDWVMPQRQYRREWPAGVEHVLDVHWQLANPVVFRSVLTFDDVARCAVAIPALGDYARAPSDVHALFIACVHRVAHHNDSPQLIWLHDIHLLASRLSTDEWHAFEALAVATEMRAVCRRGLTLAAGAFETRLPAGLIDRLECGRREASAAFLGGQTGELAIQLSNWRSLATWSARRQLLEEHLFPSASYVLAKYRVANRAWLPALYAHRMASGALRWLRASLR